MSTTASELPIVVATPVESTSLLYQSKKNEKVILQWKDLNYSILQKDAKKSSFLKPQIFDKKILKNISGEAQSGQLLAIMGPTGCGKTSLLNILAARAPDGGKEDMRLSGDIFVNSKPREDKKFRSVSAYVLQDDKLYAHLTVFETLLLAAHFYLPDEISLEMKENIVTEVLSDLGLNKVRNTIIGDARVRGVSGGERKRANIAVQLISNPSILFLDEPTSGLDSFQAQAVMESMKNMALNGRLVISVIHQPRSSIFDMFDRLLLLSEGKSMFLGNSREAAAYFSSAGFSCPKLFNPSDYFLDILSPDNRTKEYEEDSYKRILLLEDKWTETCIKENLFQIGDINSNDATFKDEFSKIQNIQGKLTFSRVIRNFRILCWRSWTEQRRNIPAICIKFFLSIFFALIIGGIYSKTGYTQKNINDRVGLLFLIVINQGFNGVMGVLNSFPKEKIIVNRERSTGAYDVFSYFLAKFFVELPINATPGIIYSTIVYWMGNLNPDPERYIYFVLIMVLEVITAITLGMCISAMSPSSEVALALGPPLVIISLIFGGFYINIDSLPPVADWIPYFSFFKWAFQALAINEFSGAEFSCEGAEWGACVKTGADILDRLSFEGKTVSESVFGVGMILIGYFSTALLILHYSKIEYLPRIFVGANRLKFDNSNNNADVKTI